jgi:hypothetical protein
MNELLFPDGGLPLYGGDFGFMQANLMAGINATLRPYAALNDGNMVVSGCDVTVNPSNQNYIISAGWVMIGYELRYFEGGDSGVSDPNGLYDIEVEAFDYPSTNPNATRNLVNNTSANVWKIRGARFKQTPNVPSLQVGFNGVRMPYLAAKLIEGAADSVIVLNDFVNDWTGGNLFQARATRRGNTVILRGLLQIGQIDINNFTQVFTLTDGWRIKQNQFFICAMPNTSIAMVNIFTNGEVWVKYILQDINNPPALLDISNIRFEAA